MELPVVTTRSSSVLQIPAPIEGDQSTISSQPSMESSLYNCICKAQVSGGLCRKSDMSSTKNEMQKNLLRRI